MKGRAEERTEALTIVYMTAAENKVKRRYYQRPEESPKHTAGPKPSEENFPGRKVSSFKCHGQKKMRQEQRPWICLSEVAVNPRESHLIKVVGPESH